MKHQNPLLEIDEGVYVRPESVQSIKACDQERAEEFKHIGPRVVVMHADRRSHIIRFNSYAEAKDFARWLADKVNEACTPDAVTDGEGAGE